MQVRAEHAALHDTFVAVVAVVAVPHHDPAERLRLRSQEGAAAVVLETDERARLELRDLRFDDDVADESLLARFGPDVDEADAREPLALGGLVVMAQQLVAAADGEHLRAVLHRLLQGRLLELEQVLVDERLLTVLAAAEEEGVDLVHVLDGPPAELEQFRFVVAPLRALEQREDVAAVAVDVHQVGVEPADGESHRFSKCPSTAWPTRASRARP